MIDGYILGTPFTSEEALAKLKVWLLKEKSIPSDLLSNLTVKQVQALPYFYLRFVIAWEANWNASLGYYEKQETHKDFLGRPYVSTKANISSFDELITSHKSIKKMIRWKPANGVISGVCNSDILINTKLFPEPISKRLQKVSESHNFHNNLSTDIAEVWPQEINEQSIYKRQCESDLNRDISTQLDKRIKKTADQVKGMGWSYRSRHSTIRAIFTVNQITFEYKAKEYSCFTENILGSDFYYFRSLPEDQRLAIQKAFNWFPLWTLIALWLVEGIIIEISTVTSSVSCIWLGYMVGIPLAVVMALIRSSALHRQEYVHRKAILENQTPEVSPGLQLFLDKKLLWWTSFFFPILGNLVTIGTQVLNTFFPQ